MSPQSGATDRIAVARQAADSLEQRAADIPSLRIVAGFDGAVDSIIRVVERRDSRDSFAPMTSMRQFAQRIDAQAGRSINIEFVVEQVKIGGNGPLFANPFTLWGASVAYIGALLADPEAPVSRGADATNLTHPVFDEFVARCAKVYAVAGPALSDACEFADGKVIIGKTAAQDAVTWDRVLGALGGINGVKRLFDGAAVFAPMNWTMLSSMTDIWRAVARDVLPSIDESSRPAMFVDLADPAKRSESDLRDAIDALRKLDALCPVTLGCNFSESSRIAAALGKTLPDDENDLARRAAALRDHTGLTGICLHTRRRAAAAIKDESFAFDAAFTSEPAISTGAGDTFNAGYALGLALDLPIAQRLALGVANSGFYVRNRKPPSIDELAHFLRDLPEPDAA